VAFGIDRNTDCLAEVEVSGKLEEIGDGAVADFRDLRLLSEERGS
jgi:hypothetical protein